MQNIAPHYYSCTECTFAPFCIDEDNQHHANLIVKQHRILKRNEQLCIPKNKFINLYAIQRGALKAYQSEADGKELIRGFYFAGEILGYETIYAGHYFYSAVALTETIICEIPYHHFLELLQAKPILQKHILYLLSQQLNVGSYLLSSTAEQRLAAFLLDLSKRLHPQQGKMILPMSRQDIGNYLRLTAETISRIFSRFQKSKLIDIDHKNIFILEPDILKNIADGLCEGDSASIAS